MNQINLYKLIIDLVIFLLLFILLLAQHYYSKVPQASFKCDDYSISYEYRKSRVSNMTLQMLTSFVPIGTIIAMKFYKIMSNRRIQTKYSIERKSSKNEDTHDANSNNIYLDFYVYIGSYLFGYLLVCFITEFCKYNLGSLRPHYLDVCKPYYFNEKETRDCSIKDIYYYGRDYNCTNTNYKLLREAQLSFPSGHASLSFYSMIFLIVYIQLKWKFKIEFLCFKYLIQFGMLLCAIYISLTRIIDNYHSFIDVLFGSCIGTTCALLVVKKLVKFSKNLNDIKGNSSKTTQIEMV
jgi:phosphatidate phosphatase